jgi:sec-independent protein translocase protein TatA
MDVGPVELLIVLAVVLLLFGSKKLPELARGMGQAAKEFRSGLRDEDKPSTTPATPATSTTPTTPSTPSTPDPTESSEGV